jgi:chemotaxis protein CheX
MQFHEQDIITVTEDVWLSTLGMVVQARGQVSTDHLHERTLDAFVNITGDWHGALLLQCPTDLAQTVARHMFDLGSAEASLEDMQDAIGELSNITGGNIKALMPGNCQLSLPAVVEGSNYSMRVPGTRAVTRLVFECMDQPLVVSLLAADDTNREDG